MNYPEYREFVDDILRAQGADVGQDIQQDGLYVPDSGECRSDDRQRDIAYEDRSSRGIDILLGIGVFRTTEYGTILCC